MKTKQGIILTWMLLLNLKIMAKEIKSQIVINASPEKVWAVLVDFKNYPNWNTFIQSISGEVKVGNKIEAYIEPPEGKGMAFKPKVLVLNANRELRWIGHLLFSGLFDGEHIFELIDNGNGTTTFIQRENFKGVLVPFFKRMLEVNTKNGFDLMNQELKTWVEKM
jgi:hypothetical protein